MGIDCHLLRDLNRTINVVISIFGIGKSNFCREVNYYFIRGSTVHKSHTIIIGTMFEGDSRGYDHYKQTNVLIIINVLLTTIVIVPYLSLYKVKGNAES